MPEEILTVQDVATFLKVRQKAIYTLAQRGELPGFKVRGQWRFRRHDLEEWIEARRTGPAVSETPPIALSLGLPEIHPSAQPDTAAPALQPFDSGVHHYVFGEHELDESCCELRRSGRTIALEPKVYAVLAYLIQHRDRVVSKDELFTALWPGQVVVEAALTRCIVQARKAVGDSGNAQQVIKTQRGHGYRFIAGVSEKDTQQAAWGVADRLPAQTPQAALVVSAPGKKSLYRLGEGLIQHRLPISLTVAVLTGFMAYHALQLEMFTSFSHLLPYQHPWVQVHFRFAEQFGGANTITVMLKVKNGDVFRKDVLTKLYAMTQAMDRISGVNHDQIFSIGHRTTRYLTISGGTIATPPVMRRPPKTAREVRHIKRICYNDESIYGQLVSLDGTALLLSANFIEGRLDYRQVFDEINRTIKEPFESREHAIYIAGEPRLYGWIYYYANEVFYIFIGASLICWLLLYLYFRDWRGALRPTITGIISAFWGLGMQSLMGFAMDPLALVIPFFVTARAISHSVQMHERYYEEYQRCNWHKDTAIVAAFAELFVPTLSGIVTDSLGMLVIILVPVVILQQIAVSAAVWVASVAVSELLLNPIVYSYLQPPRKESVLQRQNGRFQELINCCAAWIVLPRNARLIVAFWAVAFALALTQVRHLTVGDATTVTPLLDWHSPYNRSHLAIQKYFGGVEPLIIVVEGTEKGAMTDPKLLRTVERFQRYMERDPDVGYSFSVSDIIQAVSMTFYDRQPRWAVIPSSQQIVSSLFFFFFAGAPPGEAARYIDPSYTVSRVTFYCANHQGDTIARIMRTAQHFIQKHPLDKAEFRLAGGLIGVTTAANEEILKNDILMNILGFGMIFCIVMCTYRSPVAAGVLMIGLFLANGVVNAYMGFRNIGINLQSLPIVTVGVGFGIDYALYIVSRAIEEYRGDVAEAVRRGLVTAGKAVTFTAATLITATLLWAFASIRFCSEMGLLLALWMAISFLGACTFVPAVLVLCRPRFFVRAAEKNGRLSSQSDQATGADVFLPR